MRQPSEPPRELSIEGKTFKMVWRTGGGAVFECQQCKEYTFQLAYGDSSMQIRSDSLHICKSKKVRIKMKSPFEILGLPNRSNKAEVKAAYRKLAAIHHPDRGGDGDTFDEIAQAYQSALELAPGCSTCGDTGSVTTQRGFHQVKSICPVCRGRGDRV